MNVTQECDRYFTNIENFAYGEINDRGFSDPHPSGSFQKHLQSHKSRSS